MGLILVDTSVLVDHLNRPDPILSDLLLAERCLIHPYVLAEIALGNLPQWEKRVRFLQNIPAVEPISTPALLGFIAEHRLQGSGLGFVDAHLLASALSAGSVAIWTRDRRLRERAESAGMAWSPA